ncbi:MAG TPA: aminoacyl-tRNA hydrolase [Candidatus Saccharimonadales bacterium]
MKLIIGLGNPGKEYEHTRHNIGFLVVDSLAKKWGTEFHTKPKFNVEAAEITVGTEKVWLMKPNTFYNLTGEAVRKARDFYKLENKDILVIHDDIALPFGTIRSRTSGSSAGNNGIKSLNEHLGENYARIRIGTWNEHREKAEATDFVLATLSQKEKEGLLAIYPEIMTTAMKFVQNRLEPTTVVKH